jgi:hypothetical protein
VASVRAAAAFYGVARVRLDTRSRSTVHRVTPSSRSPARSALCGPLGHGAQDHVGAAEATPLIGARDGERREVRDHRDRLGHTLVLSLRCPSRGRHAAGHPVDHVPQRPDPTLGQHRAQSRSASSLRVSYLETPYRVRRRPARDAGTRYEITNTISDVQSRIRLHQRGWRDEPLV